MSGLLAELTASVGQRRLVVLPNEVTSTDTRSIEEIHADAMARGAKCTQCPLYGLHVGPVKSVAVPGVLGALADAPGPTEITTGIPMSPETNNAKFFAEHLEAMGISRSDVSIINVTECRAPESYAEYRKAIVAEHKQHKQKLRKTGIKATDALQLTPEEACSARFAHDVKAAVAAGANTFVVFGNNALKAYARTYDIPFGGKVKAAPGAPKITTLKRMLGCVVEFPNAPTIVPSYQPVYGLMKGSRQYSIGIGRWIRRAAAVAQRGGKTSWKPPKRLILRPTVEQVEQTLRRMVERAQDEGAPIYCDIETDGINVRTAKILCIAFGQHDEDGEWTVIVIPWRHGKSDETAVVSSKGSGGGGAHWWSLKAPIARCSDDPTCAQALLDTIRNSTGTIADDDAPLTAEEIEALREKQEWTRKPRQATRHIAEAGSDCARIFHAISNLLNAEDVEVTGHNFNGFDARKLYWAGFLKDPHKKFGCTMLGNKNTYACDQMHNLGYSCSLRFEVTAWKDDANDKYIVGATDEHLWYYCGLDTANTGLLDEAEKVEHRELHTRMQHATDIECAVIGKNMGELGLMVDPFEFARTRVLMREERTRHFRNLAQLVYSITQGATELEHFEQIEEWFPGNKYNLDVDAEKQFRFHPESTEMIIDILFGNSKYSRRHKPLVGIFKKDGAPEERPYLEGDKISLTAGSLIKLREHIRSGPLEKQPYYSEYADKTERDILATKFVDALLEYRAFTKITSTYIDGLIRPRGNKGTRRCTTCGYEGTAYFGNCQRCGAWLDDATIMQEDDGYFWLHPNYKYLIPTGRWSADPTIQTYPERGKLNTRRTFVAPPGYLWVGADLDQVELRLYAIISGDQKLIDVINWRGPVDPKTGKRMQIDAHAWNYATIKAKNPDDARQVKAIYDYVMKLKEGGEADKQKCKMYRNIAKRFCLAEDTLVLTKDRGEVAIQDVQLTDLLWDGVEWVSHDGVICNGEKEVIAYDGIEATADHKVWVANGQKLEFGEAIKRQYALAQTADGRRPILFLDDLRPTQVSRQVSNGFGSLQMRCGVRAQSRQYCKREIQELSDMCTKTSSDYTCLAPRTHEYGTAALCESEAPELETLRCTRYRVSICLDSYCSALGTREFGITSRNGDRQDQQQWALRAWQSQMGVASYEQYESDNNKIGGRLGFRTGRLAVRRETHTQTSVPRLHAGGNSSASLAYGYSKQPMQSLVANSKLVSDAPRRKTKVYDILNAGPRHRFTAGGKLVSNCYLIAYGGDKDKLYETMRNDRDKESGELMFPGLDEDECFRWFFNWHRAHPETKLWQQICIQAALTQGFVTSPLIDYRRRFFPGQSKGLNQQNAASNSVIQPSAAAIANLGVRTTASWWKPREWGRYSGLNLQVHDMLGGYCPAHMAEEVAKRLAESMYYKYDGMEFTAEAKYGRSWADI